MEQKQIILGLNAVEGEESTLIKLNFDDESEQEDVERRFTQA